MNSFSHHGIAFTHNGVDKISFSTPDKRKCLLIGVVKVSAELDPGRSLVGFRRKKGDPLQFRNLFASIQTALGDIIH